MSKTQTIREIEDKVSSLTLDKGIEYLQELKNNGHEKLDKLIDKYSKKKAALDKEMSRLEEMSRFESEAYENGIRVVAGIDEAGRGPLAGPVVAAAVVLHEGQIIKKLNDSKKLTPKLRDELYDIIISESKTFGIGIVDEKCIDEINILNATKMAMKIAVDRLSIKPELILIDAVNLRDVNISQKSIVKGDALSVSIAAASIIAKVTRDRIIDRMDLEYPQYGFTRHKGYGTSEHIEAIKKYGICPIHRVSFTKNFV